MREYVGEKKHVRGCRNARGNTSPSAIREAVTVTLKTGGHVQSQMGCGTATFRLPSGHRRSMKGSKHCRKRMRQRGRSTSQIYLPTEPGKPRETDKTPPPQGGVRNQGSPQGDNLCKDSREQRGDPQLSSWGTLFPSRTNKASKGENLSQISRE